MLDFSFWSIFWAVFNVIVLFILLRIFLFKPIIRSGTSVPAPYRTIWTPPGRLRTRLRSSVSSMRTLSATPRNRLTRS